MTWVLSELGEQGSSSRINCDEGVKRNEEAHAWPARRRLPPHTCDGQGLGERVGDEGRKYVLAGLRRKMSNPRNGMDAHVLCSHGEEGRGGGYCPCLAGEGTLAEEGHVG